jgi:hypothetical protein
MLAENYFSGGNNFSGFFFATLTFPRFCGLA